MTLRPSVSVVVVNWNGGKDVLTCLESLHQQSAVPDEIILVDNASTDGSLEAVRSTFPSVRTIRHDRNLGFGPGVNHGVSAARSEWVALLNNDAIADREWLSAMLDATAKGNVGMVACKVYLDRGTGLLDKVGHRLAIDGQNYGRGHLTFDHGQYDELSEVAWPDGCAALYSRNVFEHLGGIDEEFFAYADDADLGIRFRLGGWHCALAARAIVEHRHSQTLGAYSPKKLFLVERNRIWLAGKFFPPPLLALNSLLWAWRGALTLRARAHGHGPWSQVSSQQRGPVLRAILRAQLAGWAGLPRQFEKRRALAGTVGPGWEKRFLALLAEARVPLAELAKGNVN